MLSILATIPTSPSSIPLSWFLVLGLAMFTLGAIGVAIRRNPVVVFMCIELMLNAVNLTLLAFAAYLPARDSLQNPLDSAMAGQMMVIFVMAIAAAEVAVGLGIIMSIFRRKNDVDVDEMSVMRS